MTWHDMTKNKNRIIFNILKSVLSQRTIDKIVMSKGALDSEKILRFPELEEYVTRDNLEEPYGGNIPRPTDLESYLFDLS